MAPWSTAKAAWNAERELIAAQHERDQKAARVESAAATRAWNAERGRLEREHDRACRKHRELFGPVAELESIARQAHLAAMNAGDRAHEASADARARHTSAQPLFPPASAARAAHIQRDRAATPAYEAASAPYEEAARLRSASHNKWALAWDKFHVRHMSVERLFAKREAERKVLARRWAVYKCDRRKCDPLRRRTRAVRRLQASLGQRRRHAESAACRRVVQDIHVKRTRHSSKHCDCRSCFLHKVHGSRSRASDAA